MNPSAFRVFVLSRFRDCNKNHESAKRRKRETEVTDAIVLRALCGFSSSLRLGAFA
jgi:hypothetical protein